MIQNLVSTHRVSHFVGLQRRDRQRFSDDKQPLSIALIGAKIDRRTTTATS